MEALGKFVVTILIVVANTLIAGYVLMRLYKWIICPIYGLPPITQAEAIGLSFIVSFLLSPVTIHMKRNDEDKSFMVKVISSFLTALVLYAVALLTGYIISLYI